MSYQDPRQDSRLFVNAYPWLCLRDDNDDRFWEWSASAARWNPAEGWRLPV